MSSSTVNQKLAQHSRSFSLPSRSHPITERVEEQLCRLRASSEASTSPSSLISQNLSGLKNLYECVDDLLLIQESQRNLSNNDSALNGSLALLDICSTTRDVLLQMKQSAQDLQSTFRRRAADLNMTNEIRAHMSSDKKTNKVIRKCLGDIKKMNNKCFFPLLDKDQEQVAVAGVLREVEATTLAAFESILSFLSVHVYILNAKKTELNYRTIPMVPPSIVIEISKIAHHARSISLPSRSHPLTLAVEEQINRLKSSGATTSSASISKHFSGLKDLYECVEDMLLIQDRQRSLSNNDSALDGSLALLDICSTTRDVLSQMKQSAQDLQSTFRRKRAADLNMTNEIRAYMISDKKINKVIRKCLGDIKRINNKCFSPLLDKDQKQVAIASVLREVEATTLVSFESTLSFL